MSPRRRESAALALLPACHLVHQPVDFPAQRAPSRRLWTPPYLNHQIAIAEPMSLLPKHLSRQPLDPIPIDCARRRFPAHDDANARGTARVVADICAAVAPHAPCPGRQRCLIVGARQHPSPARERRPLPTAQALRRARPFDRRALITRRPPRVLILTRKPWVRLRRVFDG